MPSANPHYFFRESLRDRFFKDITQARDADRISAPEALWLGSLGRQQAPGIGAKPRVDRLLIDDQLQPGTQLIGALLISDTTQQFSKVYLSTALHGLECFATRQALLSELAVRLAISLDRAARIEYELIEGDPFEQQMLAIVDQQVAQVERLAQIWPSLPSLYSAVGETLQQQVDACVPEVDIDVLRHLLLIRDANTHGVAEGIRGTRKWAEAALASYAGMPLPAGREYRLLDAEGRELEDARAAPLRQAFSSVADSLLVVYEGLLSEFWEQFADSGVSHRELARQLFAACFCRWLLDGRQAGTITEAEYGLLKAFCTQGDVPPDIAVVRAYRVAVEIGSFQAVKLAGVLLMEFGTAGSNERLLYTPAQGFQRFASVPALNGHFSSEAGGAQLFRHASRNDYPLLLAAGNVQVRLDLVEQAPFVHCVDGIIALQKRNLADVLSKPFTSAVQAGALVEEALDVRALIEPRVSVDPASRWTSASASSESLWAGSQPGSESPASPVDAQGNAVSSSWSAALHTARARVERIFAAHPTLESCAHKLLDGYFAVLHDSSVTARHLWFQGADEQIVSVPVLLLERVSGHRPSGALESGRVYLEHADSATPVSLDWLTPALLSHVLNRLQPIFAREYARQTWGFHGPQPRIANSLVVPAGASCAIRERVLRLTLEVERQQTRLSKPTMAMIEQVLNRPVYSVRQVFCREAAEVYVPSLIYAGRKTGMPFTNALVMCQPSSPGSRSVLWTAFSGFTEFEDISRINEALTAALTRSTHRDQWLELVSLPEREQLRHYLSHIERPLLAVGLSRIDGHCLEFLDKDERGRQCRGIEYAYQMALQWKADAGLFENMAAVAERDDKNQTLIARLAMGLELRALKAQLPDWINKASTDDLERYQQLLTSTGFFDEMDTSPNDLTTLNEYARRLVSDYLKKDFPSLQLDPDQIRVTLTRYTSAPVATGDIPSSLPAATSVIHETLTRYAINRFANVLAANLSLSSLDASALPASLDAGYVREMVRELDIGSQYRQYLHQAEVDGSPQYLKRLRYFAEHVPGTLLLMALRLKLQGTLSETAYRYIENVFSMPDGVARRAVDGQRIVLSPLQFIAAPGWTADPVTGVYGIAREDRQSGPWILLAIGAEAFMFKEYASQEDFLQDLWRSKDLQALMLQRMSPDVRFIYEHGGFLQPHLTWFAEGFGDLSGIARGPAGLGIEPMQENIFHFLFRGTAQLRVLFAEQESVTTAQDDAASSRFLLMLGVDQVLAFLPGSLGKALALWQTKDLLIASAKSAFDQQWGPAVAEFSAALSVLIALHQAPGMNADSLDDPQSVEEGLTPRWYDQELRTGLAMRMQRFESHEVSLTNLVKDPLLNVFSDPRTHRRYADVSGRVYQVSGDTQNGWHLVAGERQGPKIILNDRQQWAFDTELGHRRAGGLVTRLKIRSIDNDVSRVLWVDATGIEEIQRLYPRKAVELINAYQQARRYLENALGNLTPPVASDRLDPRTQAIIADFFGTATPDAELLARLRKDFLELYKQLLAPSLSPSSSKRFVIGTSKVLYDDTSAFTFAKDPLSRIYLTQRFFQPDYVRLKPHYIQLGFHRERHYRATMLIHELSHQATNTEDIAYVDSFMPFIDLIDDTGDFRSRVRQACETFQQRTLSHRAPRDRLFSVHDPEHDTWRDLDYFDARAEGAVLKITGALDLDDARDVFLNNPQARSQVMMKNADSVALLASLLGRERFHPVAS